jgi:hypothetical protein
MSGFMSRWSIGLDRPVGEAERDADGYIKAEVLGAWLTEAVDTYLAQCAHLHRRAQAASATEIRPTEFFVSVRVSPFGGDEDLPINITCRVSIEDPQTGEPQELGTEVRDELIAIERAAEYMA